VGHYELELETIPVIEFRIEEPRTFGEYIRKLRVLKGWSQWELASEMGCYPTTIIDWEKGRYIPARKWILRLIETLEADAWEAIEFCGVITEKQHSIIKAFATPLPAIPHLSGSFL
jgi:DNA-binding XRE family transcriptional regulator